MTPEKLLEALGKAAAAKGYCLHANREHCLATAESLLACSISASLRCALLGFTP